VYETLARILHDKLKDAEWRLDQARYVGD